MISVRYLTGLLTFYMKGEIIIDDTFIYLKGPNTVLGIIPLGTTNKQLMVIQIASTSSAFHLQLKFLIMGILVAILGFTAMLNSILLGFLLVLIGTVFVISAFQTTLIINLTSGEKIKIHFLIFENEKAKQTADMINQNINQRINVINNLKADQMQIEKYQGISERQSD